MKYDDCEEVKPMDEHDEVEDLPIPRQLPPGEDHELRKLLTRAFASLRLLGVKGDTPSLEQANSQARRNADRYRNWKESGALIRDVVMRLSDGQEIEVKRTFTTGVCGFRFVRQFAPGEIIHLYKKADRQFGEVLLLSVSVDAIGADGYAWEQEYETGQTVQLSVQHFSDEQLHVSVDYTPAEGEKARGATTVLHSLIPGLSLLSSSSLWQRKTYRRSWQPSKGFASVLIGAVFLLAGLYFLKGKEDTFERTNSAPELANPTPAKSPEEKGRQDSTTSQSVQSPPPGGRAGKFGVDDDQSQPNHVAQKSDRTQGGGIEHTSKLEGLPTEGQAGTKILACEVQLGPGRKKGGELRLIANYGSQHKELTTQTTSKPRIAIYIKAFAKDNPQLTAAIERSFVNALRKRSSFTVLTEADEPNIPEDAYWVDLWFSQKPGCTGTIQATLRTGPNQIAWVGERDCHEYPNGELIKKASLELVADMVSELKEVQKGG